jgi:hypothetical protein
MKPSHLMMLLHSTETPDGLAVSQSKFFLAIHFLDSRFHGNDEPAGQRPQSITRDPLFCVVTRQL